MKVCILSPSISAGRLNQGGGSGCTLAFYWALPATIYQRETDLTQIANLGATQTSLERALGRVRRVKTILERFVRVEPGATATEYGLIAAGIFGRDYPIVKGLGTRLTRTFISESNALKEAGESGLPKVSATPGTFSFGRKLRQLSPCWPQSAAARKSAAH
jgi:Flp pilus assembly pilin Flp